MENMYSEKSTQHTPQNIVNKKQMYVHDFDKTPLFSRYEYFCRNTQHKFLAEKHFFKKVKPKHKLFLEKVDTMFQILKKNFIKTKFETNLIWLRTVGAPRYLESSAKV